MRRKLLGLDLATALAAACVPALALLVVARTSWPAFVQSASDVGILIAAFALCIVPLGLIAGLIRAGAGGAVAVSLAVLCSAGVLAAFVRPEAWSTTLALGGLAAGLALLASLRLRRSALLAVLGADLLFAVVAASSDPGVVEAPSGDSPVVLIGLDAANWEVLDQEFAAGSLPWLSRLRETGSYGTLHSEEPTLSPRVWTTLATGKHPDQHGVEDFFCTQDDLASPRMWDIFRHHGDSIGLFQWLVTWPPTHDDAFLIPGWLARDARTQPAELGFVKELELAFQNADQHPAPLDFLRWGQGYLRHGLRLRTCLDVARLAVEDVFLSDHVPRSYAAKRRIQLLLNRDLYLHLYRKERPDFSAFILYGTDNLAHKYWKYAFPDDFGLDAGESEPFSELLLDYYREADEALAEISELWTEDTAVFVVSDHGFTSMPDGSAGSEAERARGSLEYKPKIEMLADTVGLIVPDEAGVATVSTRGFITFRGSPDERSSTRRRVEEELAAIRHVDDGSELFASYRNDDGQLEIAIRRDRRHVRSDLLDTPHGRMRVGDLVVVEERSGGHSTEGVFFARGPGIRAGLRIEADLVDVLPTVLRHQGLPVADDFAGRVLEEIFDPAWLGRCSALQVESYDPLIPLPRGPRSDGELDSDLRDQLHAAGYLIR